MFCSFATIYQTPRTHSESQNAKTLKKLNAAFVDLSSDAICGWGREIGAFHHPWNIWGCEELLIVMNKVLQIDVLFLTKKRSNVVRWIAMYAGGTCF